MAATTELGRLCLSHPRAELQLIADVALTASPPLIYTEGASTTDIPATLTAPFAWLCRGRDFHLALHISLDERQIDVDLHRHLARSICNADFWQQLNLQATLAQDSLLNEDFPSTAAGILIHLTYLNQDIAPSSRHRLPIAVSIQDVQPPPGVETIRLASVQMTLDFSTSNGQKNRKDLDETGLHLQGSTYMHDQLEDVEFASQAKIAQEQTLLPDEIQGMMANAAFPSGDGLRHLNPSATIPQRIDSGTAFADDPPRKGGAKQHELEKPILELIDSALRLAICEKPPKLPSGVKISRDDLARLATVAPAVWQPNHLRLVSERAPFLPTVAHALSHSLFSNARSALLKRKAAELADYYLPVTSRTGPPSPGDVQPCKGPNSVYEAASIGLWNLLQRSHFDSGASRRLKPLTQPGDTNAEKFSEPDEMLFEISDAWQGSSHPFTDFSTSDIRRHSPLDQLSDDDMLWEYECEQAGTKRYSLSDTTEMPLGDDRSLRIFDDGDTGEQMLLDLGDVVEPGHGVASESVPEAHSLHARSRHQVSAACEDGVAGEPLLLETTGQFETSIQADAYDCLPAGPEMLFDAEI